MLLMYIYGIDAVAQLWTLKAMHVCMELFFASESL